MYRQTLKLAKKDDKSGNSDRNSHAGDAVRFYIFITN